MAAGLVIIFLPGLVMVAIFYFHGHGLKKSLILIFNPLNLVINFVQIIRGKNDGNELFNVYLIQLFYHCCCSNIIQWNPVNRNRLVHGKKFQLSGYFVYPDWRNFEVIIIFCHFVLIIQSFPLNINLKIQSYLHLNPFCCKKIRLSGFSTSVCFKNFYFPEWCTVLGENWFHRQNFDYPNCD